MPEKQFSPVQLNQYRIVRALDMTAKKLMRSTDPPAYAIIEIQGDDVLTNYRDTSP